MGGGLSSQPGEATLPLSQGQVRATLERGGGEESALGDRPRGAGAGRWEQDKTWAGPGGSVNQSHKPWAPNRVSFFPGASEELC